MKATGDMGRQKHNNMKSKPSEPKTAWSKLTPRQQAFVTEYLTDFNACRAAQAVGHAPTSGAAGGRARGSELVANRNIRAAIDEKLAERGVSKESLINRFAQMAFGADMADFEPYINGSKSLAQLKRAGINTSVLRSVDERHHKDGGTSRRVQLYDAFKASESLGKLLGYVINKMELRPGGAWLDELRALSDEDLERAARTAGANKGEE